MAGVSSAAQAPSGGGGDGEGESPASGRGQDKRFCYKSVTHPIHFPILMFTQLDSLVVRHMMQKALSAKTSTSEGARPRECDRASAPRAHTAGNIYLSSYVYYNRYVLIQTP